MTVPQIRLTLFCLEQLHGATYRSRISETGRRRNSLGVWS